MSIPTPSIFQQALIDGMLRGENVISNSVAGSGKSTTGMNVISAYLEQYPSNTILLTCFQKNVQQEFDRKAKNAFPNFVYQQLTIRTTYSMGLSLLKQHHPTLTAPQMFKANLIIAKLLSILYKQMGGKESSSVIRMLGEYEDTKRMCVALYQISQARLIKGVKAISELEQERSIFPFPPERSVIEVVSKAMAISELELEREDKYDFTDMISYAARNGYQAQEKFDHIIVDECQDLSPAQLAVIQAYAHNETQWTFLGDRSQQIMMFAGSMLNTMDTLKSTYNAVEYRIPISYRIPLTVRDMAREFVPDLEARDNAPKGFVGYANVSKAVEKMQGGDMLLARTVAQLLEVSVIALANKKKISFRGQDIKSQILDALATIRRRWGLKEFGYGVNEYIHENVLMIKEKYPDGESDEKIDELHKLGAGLIALYKFACRDGCKHHDFESFVSELFNEKDNKKELPIYAMSIHQAKGGESNTVWLIQPQGGFPYRTQNMSKQQQSEEDNIAYVGFTRAKNALWFVVPDGQDEDKVKDTLEKSLIETELKHLDAPYEDDQIHPIADSSPLIRKIAKMEDELKVDVQLRLW